MKRPRKVKFWTAEKWSRGMWRVVETANSRELAREFAREYRGDGLKMRVCKMEVTEDSGP